MDIRTRQQLILVLIAVFFVQTYFVYSDPAGRRATPLSEQAADGRDLWHRHNCQSCHQLYGFGGFLGPDLTNAVSDLTPARLESILTGGSGRMPAFGFSSEERGAIAAFLGEMNRTGVSDPKLGKPVSARELLGGTVDALAAMQGELTDLEAAGRAILLEQSCIDCHLPNARSAFRAPDLTQAVNVLSTERLHTVLVAGIPEKGMPRLNLDEDERASVLAFLEFLERSSATIQGAFENAEKRTTGAFPLPPWFEYPPR